MTIESIRKVLDKNHGLLHRALHVPAGQRIPDAKLARAARSSNPKLRRRAQLAQTLRKLP